MQKADFPDTPQLQYLDFVQNSDNTAIFKIGFTDGDGDIGLRETDTLAPYNYNLFMILYEKRLGKYFPLADTLFRYRIPILENSGRIKALEGTLNVNMPFYFNPGSPYDTIYFTAYLLDRKLNKSNIIETREIITP